ncbi:hypothetical protein [Streptomyces actuosus]|uniref:hypothetical protein n=1 Tax=Streptomyces actuosus TaxID=1885 RepID=UPI0027DA6D41|nr:hypothetical protein [Streptomyces actuosus]
MTVVLVVAVIVGVGAGWLARLDQATWPAAATRAAVAFAATVTLFGVAVTAVTGILTVVLE